MAALKFFFAPGFTSVGRGVHLGVLGRVSFGVSSYVIDISEVSELSSTCGERCFERLLFQDERILAHWPHILQDEPAH